MKPIHEVLNRREGNLIAGYLNDHGVAAEVRGGSFQSVEGEISNIRGTLPVIHVLDDRDEEKGRDLVKAYLAMMRSETQGEPWLCPQCGESLEPQFLSCWKCQTEKPV